MKGVLLPRKTAKDDTRFTQNRELSWLRFNERVLQEAEDTSVPIYERLKFVDIFTNNLDEFFMVRVGSLIDMSHVDPKERGNKSRFTPGEQLEKIFAACQELYPKRDRIYNDVRQELAKEGVVYRDFMSLDVESRHFYEQEFIDRILPILSPQIIDSHHPFPHLANKGLFAAALLKHEHRTTLGMIPIPKTLPRYILMPSNRMEYILIENVILAFMSKVFSGYPIIDRGVFCITRNTDINPDDGDMEYDDYLKQMRTALQRRKHLPPNRIEIQTEGDSLLAPFLAKRLNLSLEQVFISRTPLTLDYVYGLENEFTQQQKTKLCYPSFTPVTYEDRFAGKRMMDVIRREDVLLSYPYDDFGIFLKVVKDAVYDPDVASIKITIYRIGKGHVKLMNYLSMAAELGKDVVVLLELKARFDEENNMGWVESLRDAGVRILYGFEGYKVHAKLCLISSCCDGVFSYITYVGTGNFNAKTAKLYTDLALLTADRTIGEDAAEFFRNMGIANLYGTYQILLVAPVSLKQQLLQMIQQEIDRAKRGKPARILLKMNSLTDRDLIDKLVEANQAGSSVDLIVRGICCLVPEIPAVTENIHVRSIVGRFLEHSRIFVFGVDDTERVYIASADWMTRNTENRVEVACPVHDRSLCRRILSMLALQLCDNTKARKIGSDGLYHVIENGDAPIRSQEMLMEQAQKEKVLCL